MPAIAPFIIMVEFVFISRFTPVPATDRISGCIVELQPVLSNKYSISDHEIFPVEVDCASICRAEVCGDFCITTEREFNLGCVANNRIPERNMNIIAKHIENYARGSR
jgi:hypothetical protein